MPGLMGRGVCVTPTLYVTDRLILSTFIYLLDFYPEQLRKDRNTMEYNKPYHMHFEQGSLGIICPIQT